MHKRSINLLGLIDHIHRRDIVEGKVSMLDIYHNRERSLQLVKEKRNLTLISSSFCISNLIQKLKEKRCIVM